VIVKIIDPTVIWTGGASSASTQPSSYGDVRTFFDIVDLSEEREMRAAESWLLLETGAIDFGGPAFYRTSVASGLAL
jgi:hypothetical protein